jgi:hypothetical protein
MRFGIQLLTIALMAFVMELFLPWWSIAIAAALGGYILKSRANFLAGFLAIGILWLIMAVKIDNSSSSHLSEKIAAIFQLNKYGLLAITSILGGIIGGLAALTGSLAKPSKKRTKSLYH